MASDHDDPDGWALPARIEARNKRASEISREYIAELRRRQEHDRLRRLEKLERARHVKPRKPRPKARTVLEALVDALEANSVDGTLDAYDAACDWLDRPRGELGEWLDELLDDLDGDQ